MALAWVLGYLRGPAWVRVALQAELLALCAMGVLWRQLLWVQSRARVGQATIGARALWFSDVRGMPHGVGRRAEALGQAATLDRA